MPALLSLLCASTVGFDGCFGGPTSDWPRGNHDEGKNADDEPPSMPAEVGKPGTVSSPPVLGATMDAGTSTSVPPRSAPGSYDSQNDAGIAQPDDGGSHAEVVHPFDGGMKPSCTIDSNARDAGACFGVSCASDMAQLARGSSAVGACRDADDLSLVCDGELTRIVSACAQSEALMLGLGTSVTECARSEPSLEHASDGCIDCYVDELLCAAQNCLAPCLAGKSPSCTGCRAQHCSAAFQVCAGLFGP